MCPVNPSDLGAIGSDGWASIEDSPIPVDNKPDMDKVVVDEEVDADSGDAWQTMKGMPEPILPSRAVIDRHNLTHLPYKSWCPHCVAARRNAAPHLTQKDGNQRSVPLLVFDYAFPRSAVEEDTVTCLIGKMYPMRTTFAVVCDQKGRDPHVVSRLAAFIRENGVQALVYKSDQEDPITAMAKEAIKNVGIEGQPYDDKLQLAVPELSAVGSSQSNGRAERTVQIVEDMVRTYRSALQARIECAIPSGHPVFRWMLEHVAGNLNRCSVTPEGMTPYQHIHGKRVTQKQIEFGEKIFYYTPKRVRAKLDNRYHLGVYLGQVSSSNECYVATSNGGVIKTRSVARVVTSCRWDAKLVMNIKGIPTHLNLGDSEAVDYKIIEEEPEPHRHADDADRDKLDDDQPAPDQSLLSDDAVKTLDRQIRITRADLNAYGSTPGCPRCADIEYGLHQTKKSHSRECRLRMYLQYREHDSPKWRAVRHLLDPSDAQKKDLPPVDEERGQIDLPPPSQNDLPLPHDEPRIGGKDGEILVEDPPDILHGGDQRIDQEDPFHLSPEQAWDMFGPEDDNQNESMDESELEEISAQDMVDSLMAAGAKSTHAHTHVNKMFSFKHATFVELYGRGKIVEEANLNLRSLNVRGIGAFDCRTLRPDQVPWNFNRKADRKMARDILDTDDPKWVVGSPPCTAFCQWNLGINRDKMDPVEYLKMKEEGRRHLGFACKMYKRQIDAGNYFIHEHPAGASSWNEPNIKQLRNMPGVYCIRADQCAFGLMTPGPDGKPMHAKKPTRFLTNSLAMARMLQRLCDKSHKHQQLSGGRCADAAFYPLELVRAMIRGMSEQGKLDMNCKSEMEENAAMMNALTPNSALPSKQSSNAKPRESMVKKTNGKSLLVTYNPHNFKTKYVDEYTGEILEPHLIADAIIDELDYFNQHVWRLEEKSQMYAVPDHIFVRSRWIMCNKGDSANPDMRARLVACEVNKEGKNDLFHASTPPLEAKKALFSMYASQRTRGGKPLRLSFVDIRKAYFNGIPTRSLYMSLPPELGLPPNLVAKQIRCVYGTRDAGKIWESCYSEALTDMGFVAGSGSPCCFYHPTREMNCVVHGDDFTCMGLDEDLDYYEAELAKRFELKIRGRLGEGCDLTEIKILNRILRICPDGVEYEADPRHVELLTSSLGLSSANSVKTPGIKDPDPRFIDDKGPDVDSSHMEIDEGPDCKDEEPNHPRDFIQFLSSKMDRKTAFDRERKVTFCEDVDYYDVPAYSEYYGIHPRHLLACDGYWKNATPTADAFTGKSPRIMNERRARRRMLHGRTNSINSLIAEGVPLANDEHDESMGSWSKDRDHSWMCATRTKPVKKPPGKKRAGAREVKKLERIQYEGFELSPQDATTFRALSARGNFLSMDRTDISYSSKELCRDFSVPNKKSYEKLKRMARYLAGHPRLIHKFPWQNPEEALTLNVYVDTDFAGCRESRRSTSGGVALLGSHTIKHWSKTQTTLALSSGEAELHGIAAGMAQAIGIQTILRDLGFNVKIMIHSDATAAIGIARRKGMGKIRHLDVSDLWIQDKIRSGAIGLSKVDGSKNPADALTKYVDAGILQRSMTSLGLEVRQGRPEAAPEAMGIKKA